MLILRNQKSSAQDASPTEDAVIVAADNQPPLEPVALSANTVDAASPPVKDELADPAARTVSGLFDDVAQDEPFVPEVDEVAEPSGKSALQENVPLSWLILNKPDATPTSEPTSSDINGEIAIQPTRTTEDANDQTPSLLQLPEGSEPPLTGFFLDDETSPQSPLFDAEAADAINSSTSSDTAMPLQSSQTLPKGASLFKEEMFIEAPAITSVFQSPPSPTTPRTPGKVGKK